VSRSRPVGDRRYRPDPAVVGQAVDSIVRAYHPQRIIVFGSFARDDTNELSDLDLLVVKETDERYFRRLARVRDACMGVAVDVQPFVYTPAELQQMVDEGNSFLEAALSEGIVAYDAARD
jgi:predicted nucleotidyltransferase